MSELAKALVAAQAEMPVVAKTAKGSFGKYATLDALIEAVRPVLNKHDVGFAQFPSISDLGQPTLVTRLMHVSGDALEYAMPLLTEGSRQQGMQGLGSAITYARRYALASALGIASEHDDDGTATTQPRQASANGDTPKVISEPQRKRLYAMSKEAALSDEQLKALVKEIAGVDSSKEIPAAVYDRLCEAVQAEAVPF